MQPCGLLCTLYMKDSNVTFSLVLETILDGNKIQMISLMVTELSTLKGTPDLTFNS